MVVQFLTGGLGMIQLLSLGFRVLLVMDIWGNIFGHAVAKLKL